jgi:hypothetical protein
MQEVATPAPESYGVSTGSLLWEGWLPLSPCNELDKGMFGDAKMQVSVIVEEPLGLKPPLASADASPGKAYDSFSMTEESEDRHLEHMQSFRLSMSVEAEETPVAAAHSSGPSLLSSLNRPASLNAQHPANAEQRETALEFENERLRTELKRAQQEAAMLRSRHDEDRQRVQEKLVELEAEVRGRWQQRVTELEQEVSFLRASIATAGKKQLGQRWNSVSALPGSAEKHWPYPSSSSSMLGQAARPGDTLAPWTPSSSPPLHVSTPQFPPTPRIGWPPQVDARSKAMGCMALGQDWLR